MYRLSEPIRIIKKLGNINYKKNWEEKVNQTLSYWSPGLGRCRLQKSLRKKKVQTRNWKKGGLIPWQSDDPGISRQVNDIPLSGLRKKGEQN